MYQPASDEKMTAHMQSLQHEESPPAYQVVPTAQAVPVGEAVPTGAVPTGAVPTGAVPTGAVPTGVSGWDRAREAWDRVSGGLYPALGARRNAVPVEQAVSSLTKLGFPPGLAKELHASAEVFPYRFWVVDNSGSMQAGDGSRLVQDAAGATKVVKSTRWHELTDVVCAIGELASALGARTEFQLLNRPSGAPARRQRMAIGGCGDDAPVASTAETVDLQTLRSTMRAISPSGGTPLTEAVMQIVSALEPAADTLRARGQQAVVVLATDGLPNCKGSFTAALKQLQALPVWLVVRLCTDDETVVDFWNELDASLEAPLEVLDDEGGEAEEVTAHNRWLNYGPPLHRAREFGLHNKLFDLLDEAALVPFQQRQLCELLLGGRGGGGEAELLPEPDDDLQAFRAAVQRALVGVPTVYDPVAKQKRPWINAALLGTPPPCASRDQCTIL